MTTDTLATFGASLDRLDVGWTRTDPAGLAAALDAATDRPAVGVQHPEFSLPDWVDTDPTPAALDAAVTGITPAHLAVADYGSVLLAADPEGTEPVSLFPERHVAVLRADDVVADMPSAFARLGPWLREGRGSTVIATGPSATADMGALVRGAHGPRTVHVVVVDE